MRLLIARLALPAAIAAALAMGAIVQACFTRPLFGGGATYSYPGISPNTPIPDPTADDNASPALIGGRRTLDAGKD